MARYTCKIIIRDDQVAADGTAALALQAFINKKRTVIALGMRVRPDQFDKKAQLVRIKGDRKREKMINALIHQAKAKAEDIFMMALLHRQTLTRETFKAKFNDEASAMDFLAWMEATIEKEVGIKAPGTIKDYRKNLNRLRKMRKSISFADLNLDLVKDFHRWMKAKRLADNTIWCAHKVLKRFINLARKEQPLLKNPYDDFPIRFRQTQRVYLTPVEVRRLVAVYDRNELDDHLQRVLRQFLFMVFTGLRIGDMKQLTRQNLAGGYLIFRPEKTKESRMYLKVPLNQMARRLIDEAEGHETIFATYKDDQVFRRYLKIVTRYAMIDKHVTAHTGRHTFATLFLLKGGKVEVLSRILGHRKLETTMVYVHILDEEMRAQIERLDDLLAAG